jgi:hypothetical protein
MINPAACRLPLDVFFISAAGKLLKIIFEEVN